MIRLKHRLIVAAGFLILIAAVAALDAGGLHPPGHDVAAVDDDPHTGFASSDDSTSSDGAVHALFDLHHPETAPFPSDVFTVADHTHNTGRRANLPYPDCSVQVSYCEDLNVINTLDGFGLQTRVSIPFDSPIDPTSVNSENVFLIALESYLPGANPGGDKVGINQVVWDPETNTLHVETDALLDQARRYAVIVTEGVLRSNGVHVTGAK